MEKIKLPNKYEIEEIGENKSKIVIEPISPGFGTTLGNAMRRVLLSSIDGAAITSVKIKGVDHEFSTMSGVKEDVVDIVLNFKKIRLKVDSDEPVKLKLSVKGEKVAKAKDIEKNAQVEIINKEQEIATLTDPRAEFEVEIQAVRGRGYVPVESREKEKLETGVIAIDAIFTPIKIVNFKVENIRVEQMTNWNRLVLEVETDGAVTPQDAVKSAAEILVDHFALFADPDKIERESAKEKKSAKKEEVEETALVEEGEDALIKTAEESVLVEAMVDKPKKKRGRPKKNPDA